MRTRWFGRNRWEQKLDAELRFHIEQQVQNYIGSGDSPEEARRKALLDFGGLEQIKEECRSGHRLAAWEALWQDLRYAIRLLRKSPAFTATAILSLALGIGSATAVFSIVDRILFRDLPYSHSDRLVSVGIVAPFIRSEEWLFSSTYQEWRDDNDGPFEALTSWIGEAGCDISGEEPQRINCARVESTFLSTLGIQPFLGRNFIPEEDIPGAEPVGIVSYAAWQSYLGSDLQVIGRNVTVDGVALRIVGVLPASFELPNLSTADVLIPQALKRGSERMRLVRAIGRLRPGIEAEQARAALDPLYEQSIDSMAPDFRRLGSMQLRVERLRDLQVRESTLASWLLLAAVLAVLLIACANVANLLLARAAARTREVALRSALGASRSRLMRQNLTESAFLGVIGGTAGCCLAYVLLSVFVALAPAGIIRLHQATLDFRILIFATGASLICGVLFGLAPGFGSTPISTARQTGSSKSLKPAFVVFQIASSLVLLTCATLLLRTLWNLQNTRLGFRSDHVLTASFILNSQHYGNDYQQLNFFERLEGDLAQLPGVTAIAITDSLPPAGDPRTFPLVAVKNPGGNANQAGMQGDVIWRYVTPGYFSSLGIPIVRGRGFGDKDRQAGDLPVIVNESLAAQLFPREDAVGKSIQWIMPGTIMGVAQNAKNGGLAGDVRPELYVLRRRRPDAPFNNARPPHGWRQATAIVRTSIEEGAVAASMRSTFRKLDPDLPIIIDRLDHDLGTLLQRPKFNAALLSFFAFSAILLALIGLYGVLAYSVAERKIEMGIRMALGARPSDILKLVMGQGLALVLAGAAIGVAASVTLTRIIAAMLYGVSPTDPSILLVVTLLLIFAAALATYIPARRAASIDPMQALRAE